MARVDIEQDEEEPIGATYAQEPPPEPEPEEPRQTRSAGRKRSRAPDVEVQIEQEITKRQIIQSVSSIVVVILYMLFTLLRERDAGVVILDDEGPEDDWAE